jgi:uncharacterized protein
MSISRWLIALLAIGCFAAIGSADEPKQNGALKRLLLVTDSGGFVHDSVGLSEQILKKLGPDHGFEVECYRYTRDPNSPEFAKYAALFREKTGVTVDKENCGRVNAETLKKFDCVLFFTTGNPLNPQEVKDLAAWVKAGGAVAGVHCGSDTLYPDNLKGHKGGPWNAAYGDLIGAYFISHPWHQKIKLKVEDPEHAAGKSFKNGDEITDEIYQFSPEPYSRRKLHIILSVDNSSIDVSKGERKDNDYAISWCQDIDKGRSFYTSLGHHKEVWNDKRYQEHLFGGLNWAVNKAPGSAVPSDAKTN